MVCNVDVVYVGVGVPLPMVTFDPCHAPPTLTLAHPNPSPSVNELEDPGAIVGSVLLEVCVCTGDYYEVTAVNACINFNTQLLNPWQWTPTA